MNIMVELSEVWSARNKTASFKTDELVTNPLPYFEETLEFIQTLIVQTYKARNCTYAELLEDVRKIDPDIVNKYFELFDALDCDVYGRWCTGMLTLQEYQTFCRTVDEWKEITKIMIETIKEGKQNE